jgi:hypothetical protein
MSEALLRDQVSAASRMDRPDTSKALIGVLVLAIVILIAVASLGP